jgi:hypothetical protein
MERESGMNEVPACFSVERDADGVLKIRYQKPTSKYWPIYFKVVISYFLIGISFYLCYLLVHGSRFAFNLPFSPNLAFPSILFYLLLIPVIGWGAHGRISDQTLSLQESELVVTYHNLPFGRRYSIPKSGVRRLVQSRTDEIFVRGFNLTLVDSENRPLLIGESAKATRWLGETLVRWAGAECKLVAEDGGRMSNPAKIAEG